MDAQNWSRESILELVEWAKEREPTFHQFVLLLEKRFQQIGSNARTIDPHDEVIRFRAARSLSFGLADIAQIDLAPDGPTRLDLRVNFLGLYGPSSPLPPHYTERIVQSDVAENPLEDFFDFFNHRLVMLSHAIWRKYRHHERYQKGAGDPISQRVFSLIGLQPVAKPSPRQLRRATILPQAGLLSLYSRSASIVAGLVTHYFKVPCEIEEFVERNVTISDDDKLRLGEASGVLGDSFVLGDTVPDVTGRFRLKIGPVTRNELAAFLPVKPEHQTLIDLIALALREPLEWDLRISLIQDEARPWKLGEGRLGWNIWTDPVSGKSHEADLAPWSGYRD